MKRVEGALGVFNSSNSEDTVSLFISIIFNAFSEINCLNRNLKKH